MSEPNATPQTPAAKPNAGTIARKPEAEDRSFDAAAQNERKATLGDAGLAGQTSVVHTSPAGAPYELADIWRDAFTPLLSAQMEANRWFDSFWRQATGTGAHGLRTGRPFGGLGVAPALGLPAADLRETDDAYQLSVELPGMSRDDIELKIDRDVVRLSGRKIEEKEDARADYRISERRFGRFERAFPIPQDVRRDEIQAKYADGLLKIVLPKSAPAAREAGARIEIR